MDKPRIRETHGPEWKIQRKFIRFLRARKWLVEVSNGNMFQVGWPDLYMSHKRFGQRWVDVKNPASYVFTKDQKIKWPEWEKYGVGIWIVIAPTEEEYDKLFKPPNWRKYWKPQWDLEPTVDELLDKLDAANEQDYGDD